MFLFDVPVLVGDAEVVGRRLQVVVRHQEPVAFLGLGTPVATERMDGRAEMIGAVLARYAAYLPEAGLEPFDQALVALAEADLDRLDVRVHQHQVEDQVRKRHAAQRHAQAAHVGEVGLRRFAGLVDLGKDHLAARTVLSPPRRDLTMQRA